jgi:hypothetical protein
LHGRRHCIRSRDRIDVRAEIRRARDEAIAVVSGSPAFVEVDGIARSLVPIDGGLALGFDTQLVTIQPQCR